MQSAQIAVAHLHAVTVIVDTAGSVEIAGAVGYRGVLEVLGVSGGSGSADRGFVVTGHVVDHSVDVDAHAHGVAATDHVREVVLVAGTSYQLVGQRLVALVPGSPWEHDVLIDRGYLWG